MHRRAGTATLLLAAALAACVKYRPQPLDPPASERQLRTRTLTDPGLVASLHQPDWPPPRLALHDLTAVALYFSPDLDVARAKLRVAQAAVVTAKARPNPSLSVGGGYETAPESPVLFSFDPSFTVITAGKRAWRVLEAEKSAEAARVAVEETAWHVRSRVRAAWIDHLMNLQALDLLHQESRLRGETLGMLEKRLSVGEASQPDVHVVRAALIATDAAAGAAETQAGESAATLATALSLPELPPIDRAQAAAPPRPIPLVDVQKAGLLHRADIRRSLLEYAALEAALRLEIANQYPDFQYSPGYSFSEGAHQFSFTPSFNIPLFNRNRGPIGEAEARRAEAEAGFKALQSQAIGEMQVALAGYNGGLEELTTVEQRLVDIQQTRISAAERAFQAGEEDRLALASVRIEAVIAARARLDALRRVQVAFGALQDSVQQSLDPATP